MDIAQAAYKIYPKDREVIEMSAEAFLADGQYAAAEKLLAQLPEDKARSGFYISI